MYKLSAYIQSWIIAQNLIEDLIQEACIIGDTFLSKETSYEDTALSFSLHERSSEDNLTHYPQSAMGGPLDDSVLAAMIASPTEILKEEGSHQR